MPKNETRKNFAAMSVTDVAELLGVSDRGVRKWIKEKGLPAKSDPRGFVLDWYATLRWFVAYQIEENAGTGGTKRGKNSPEDELETYDKALARKTRAEADLKELQLARERGQVAAIADVQRVLTASNKSIQTLLLAMPAALATQLIGLADRGRIYSIIERAVRGTLSNMANIDAILEARAMSLGAEEEE